MNTFFMDVHTITDNYAVNGDVQKRISIVTEHFTSRMTNANKKEGEYYE